MYKILSIAMLAMAGLIVLSGTADAGGRRSCYCCCAAPAEVGPVAPAPAPAPPETAQAQPRTYRSYSYEPAAPTYRTYAPSRGYRSGDPGGNFNAGRKIRGL